MKAERPALVPPSQVSWSFQRATRSMKKFPQPVLVFEGGESRLNEYFTFALLKRCPCITDLDFSRAKRLQEPTFEAILRATPRLKKLVLPAQTYINITGVSRYFPRELTMLDLKGARSMRSNCLHWLPTKGLQSLRVGGPQPRPYQASWWGDGEVVYDGDAATRNRAMDCSYQLSVFLQNKAQSLRNLELIGFATSSVDLRRAHALSTLIPVSYTHLTLPTNREV